MFGSSPLECLGRLRLGIEVAFEKLLESLPFQNGIEDSSRSVTASGWIEKDGALSCKI
jgi:hypothetical protein